MTSNNGANLISVAYNTPYNVSVVADVCGQRNSTTLIELNYASCDQPSPPTGGYILTINNASTIDHEGATVTYVCPENREKMAICTCTETGQWEPNSTSICIETTRISGGSITLNPEGKIAVASSITVFAVASILLFIIGFLCGHFCQKKRKPVTETYSPAGGQTQIPYYDDVVLQQPDEQD